MTSMKEPTMDSLSTQAPSTTETEASPPTAGHEPTHAQFVGSIPEVYDSHLGPLLFQFSALDLARRVGGALPGAGKVLEVACGTGISTDHLWRALGPDTEIVATDLNDAMLAYAKEKRGALAGVRYERADAQALPFGDETFDAVVCQFGIMFFPDKAGAMAEFARVLRPGGILAFNVWESLAHNRVAGIAQETIASFFESDPPDFLTVPFGYFAIEPIRALIAGAGLAAPEFDTVSATVDCPDIHSVARGFVEGNPGILQIRERARVDPEDIVAAVAARIEDTYGPAPTSIPLREIVFVTRKP